MDIWFEDECHFQQHGSRCIMWVPPEDVNPVIFHASTRKKVGVFGAVCVTDGRLVTQQEDKFDSYSFHAFLKRLLRHRKHGRKMIIVLDNARWHHAQQIKPWLKEHQNVIRLDFLPPYSPNLNPIERVWKLIRRLCTHNRYFPNIDDLINTVFDQFKRWQQPNETLRRLCAII